MNLRIHIDRLMSELDHLASLTDCPQATDPSLPSPQRAVTRVVFTRRDLEARRWFKDLAQQAGFPLREDAVGNTFVRWDGTDPTLPAVATGSHIDAIPFAGMYDGTVGVLGGLEALRALRESGFAPQRSVELVLFTSEEPTRFGIGCLGSRLLSGALPAATADALPDRLHESDGEAVAGGTLRSVRHGAGFVGELDSVYAGRPQYAAWIELHIEQGPLLERESNQLGVVTHIAGPASYRYGIQGVGGHAGALLMPDRRDALCAAAEMILAVEQLVTEANRQAGAGHNSVGTVGKLEVHPGAVNAVPSRVSFMLDIRDTDLAVRNSIMQQLRARSAEIENRRGVSIMEEAINADVPVTCDAGLVALLTETAKSCGARVAPMVSRAYHDTTFMAQIAPSAMLFLPCRGGVSHGAEEYASPEAIALGTEVLARTLASLSGTGTAPAPSNLGRVD